MLKAVWAAWRARRAAPCAAQAAAARFGPGTAEADLNALRCALAILRGADKAVDVTDIDRFVVSGSRRYCAMTLIGGPSYAVDLLDPAYLHWPGAGVSGFEGEQLQLEPDERRFALEAWWIDPYLEDLRAPLMPWQRVAAPSAG